MNAVNDHGHNGNEKRWPARQDGSERSGPLFEDEDQNEKDDLLAKMKAREVDPFFVVHRNDLLVNIKTREVAARICSLKREMKIWKIRQEIRAPYTERRISVRNDDVNSYRISLYFTHTKIHYKNNQEKDIFIFIYVSLI